MSASESAKAPPTILVRWPTVTNGRADAVLCECSSATIHELDFHEIAIEVHDMEASREENDDPNSGCPPTIDDLLVVGEASLDALLRCL